MNSLRRPHAWASAFCRFRSVRWLAKIGGVLAAAFQFVDPHHTLELFDVRLVGVNAETGNKLLFTIALIVGLMVISKVLRLIARGVTRRAERIAFWIRQAIHVLTALVLIVGVVSIWFDNPARLTTAIGLVTAGIAFALQRVITALAGYILILRGNTFNVGDRIVMGGVRGDVIALGFMQTTIMEMGQPPPVQSADPAMWVKSRQYTGRIVSVSNAQLFEEPVYNYTREFPYIWDEISLPVSYRDDRHQAERILLAAADHHTLKISHLGEPAIKELERRYVIKRAEMKPRVFWRITDNWLDLTVRFLVEDHGVRDVKDAMNREILSELDRAGIGIASTTFDVVGLPKLRIEPVGNPAVSEPNGQKRTP
jgi:small-conductance mechanosensitive channel